MVCEILAYPYNCMVNTFTMILTGITNDSLLQKTKTLAQNERELTLNILQHLREIERRRLFAEIGFPSLFEYAVKELGYSEGAAQRRISSMRLLKSVPEITQKVESGAMTLTTLAKAQSFFRAEKIETKKQKLEVLNALVGKSAWEVQKTFVARAEHPEKLFVEKVKPVSKKLAQITLLADEELLKQIEELKNLRGGPAMQLQEVFKFALGETLKKLRSKKPSVAPIAESNKKSGGAIIRPAPTAAAAAMGQATRYIPSGVRRQVWQRDEGKCRYIDPKSGRKCSCKYGLELDHIKPFARGGKNQVDNLRLLCFAHNQHSAIRTFGRKKMEKHVANLRA